MMYASSCSVHFFFMVSLGGALSFRVRFDVLTVGRDITAFHVKTELSRSLSGHSVDGDRAVGAALRAATPYAPLAHAHASQSRRRTALAS